MINTLSLHLSSARLSPAKYLWLDASRVNIRVLSRTVHLPRCAAHRLVATCVACIPNAVPTANIRKYRTHRDRSEK